MSVEVEAQRETLRQQFAQVTETVDRLDKVADRFEYVVMHWDDDPGVTKRGPSHA